MVCTSCEALHLAKFVAIIMAIKLETNEPCLTRTASVSKTIQNPTPNLAPEPVDKKSTIVVRANATQLAVLKASFAKTQSPNKVELDMICKETGLYVLFYTRSPQVRRSQNDGRLCSVNLFDQHEAHSHDYLFFCFLTRVAMSLNSAFKWIKAWYGRKRRSQKKALGTLAVKTEVGDPAIPTSGASVVSDIAPQTQPQSLGRAGENTPLSVEPTKALASSNTNGTRMARTLLTSSRRYAPYPSSKNVVAPSVTSSSADKLPLSPSGNLRYQSATGSRLPATASNNTNHHPSPLIENINKAPRKLQPVGRNLDSAYAWSTDPNLYVDPLSHPYPGAYNPNSYVHVATPPTNRLPDFDTSGNTNSLNNTIANLDIPVHIPDYLVQFPAPMQDLQTLYGHSIDTRLGSEMAIPMKDSAFVPFSYFREEQNDGSQFHRRLEVDFYRRGQDLRYSYFPELLSGTGAGTSVGSGLEFPQSFPHFRQGEQEIQAQFQTRGKLEAAINIPPSTDVVIPTFEPSPRVTVNDTQPRSLESPSAFPGFDIFSTPSHFPAPLRIHPHTPKNHYDATPANFSPSFQSLYHQYICKLSSEESSPLYHQLMIPTSASTPSESFPTNNKYVDPGVQISESDLKNATLHALATEEDTFTAAIMLVVLSRAGFVWDH